jgi:hypothetical protein
MIAIRLQRANSMSGEPQDETFPPLLAPSVIWKLAFGQRQPTPEEQSLLDSSPELRKLLTDTRHAIEADRQSQDPNKKVD